MKSRKTALPLTSAAVLVGALLITPTAIADETESQDSTNINGYVNVGYYGAWQANGESGVSLKNLFVDGNAGDHITHLVYSFGNVAGSQEAIEDAKELGVQGLDDVDQYTCFISNESSIEGLERGIGETDTSGDAQNDFLHLFDADNSVAGVADTEAQQLAGNFNQLKQIKYLYPDVTIKVGLGGWSWSKSFSEAVRTEERREALAESCIDLYIRGNLPEIDGFGGEGAAAGIFSGFDLDWEWPGITDDTGLVEPGNIAHEDDGENFKAFAKLLREKLDEEAAKTGESYELSAFLPVNGQVIQAGGWNDPEFFQYLDFGHLMGYDFHGPWHATQTGHQGNLIAHPDGHNWGLSLEAALSFYVNGLWNDPPERGGIPTNKIVVGTAGYGYGWQNAALEPWGEADGTIPFTPWDQLKNKPGLETHYEIIDDRFSATYGYVEETQEWWTFDDPRSVTEKTEWAISQGLAGTMIWELANDRDLDLPKAASAVMRDADTGPVSGTELGTTPPIEWPVPEENDPALSVTGKAYLGAEITVHGEHFTPGDDVQIELHSTPALLGLTTADAEGSFSLVATIPADLSPGLHTVVALVDGVAVATYEIEVLDALAVSGIGSTSAIAALVLLIAGGGALTLNRRRALS